MDGRKFSAKRIAQFFILKGVSPLKLQKLLYYSQVWWLKKTDQELIYENFKAWVYGPAIPDIWHTYKFIKRSDLIPSFKANPIDLPVRVVNHLEEVWDKYGLLSDAELVDLSHNEYPWKSAREQLNLFEKTDRTIEFNANTTKEYKLICGSIPEVNYSKSRGHYHKSHYYEN